MSVDFYRVALHDDAMEGPYRSIPQTDAEQEARRTLLDAGHDWSDEAHPSPRDDGLYWPEEDEFCGFATLTDLRTWFDGLLDALSAGGFRLFHYQLEPDDIRMGGKQALGRISAYDPICVEALA